MLDSRLKNWNTNPMWRRRKMAQPAVDKLSTRCPRSQISPLVAGSRPPRTCSRVDLPEPDGPMMATNSPMASSMSTPRTASTVTPLAR